MAFYGLAALFVSRRLASSKKIFDCLERCTALEAVSIAGSRRRCRHSTPRIYEKQDRWNSTTTRAAATPAFSTVGRRSTARRKSSSSSSSIDDTTDAIETAIPTSVSSSTAAPASTTLKLYRDCLRLVHHIAPGGTGTASNKHVALKRSVTVQFKRNMHETDEHAIERYKADAVRALSNYLLMASINAKSIDSKTSQSRGATATNYNATATATATATAATTHSDGNRAIKTKPESSNSHSKLSAAMQSYHDRSVAEAKLKQRQQEDTGTDANPISRE